MSAENPGPRAQSPAKIAAGGVKKGRNEGEKVVTANRLTDGAVIYRAPGGAWTEDLQAAEVVEGEAALGALAAAQADESESVGPYLMDVDTSDVVRPDGRAKLRETIREAGPTIHPQFGRSLDFGRRLELDQSLPLDAQIERASHGSGLFVRGQDNLESFYRDVRLRKLVIQAIEPFESTDNMTLCADMWVGRKNDACMAPETNERLVKDLIATTKKAGLKDPLFQVWLDEEQVV